MGTTGRFQEVRLDLRDLLAEVRSVDGCVEQEIPVPGGRLLVHCSGVGVFLLWLSGSPPESLVLRLAVRGDVPLERAPEQDLSAPPARAWQIPGPLLKPRLRVGAVWPQGAQPQALPRRRPRPSTRPDGPQDGRTRLGSAQIARLCGVSRRTVARWLDRGLLPSARLGAGRRYGVLPADLAEFLRTCGRPVPRALEPIRGVLVWALDPREASKVEDALRGCQGVEVRRVANGVGAGIELVLSEPRVLVVHLAAGQEQVAEQVRQVVQSVERQPEVVFIGPGAARLEGAGRPLWARLRPLLG